jgi:hypothetical protein
MKLLLLVLVYYINRSTRCRKNNAYQITNLLPYDVCAKHLETTKIHSVAGEARVGLMDQKAFYHITTISNVALVGGGSYPAWRELYGAQRVLFLDEAPEFKEMFLVLATSWKIELLLSEPSFQSYPSCSCLLLV